MPVGSVCVRGLSEYMRAGVARMSECDNGGLGELDLEVTVFWRVVYFFSGTIKVIW